MKQLLNSWMLWRSLIHQYNKKMDDKVILDDLPVEWGKSVPIDPSKTIVTALDGLHEVDKPVSFTVETFLPSGVPTPGGIPVGVKVSPPEDSSSPDVTLKDNNDGTYDLQFVPKVPGDYTVSLHVNDE
eukprot:TRINITY_DN1730_c0_g1_i15.p1 TRINITY_DN1730_c0_g1~~TRINITY_DN1730_c0_g1_i15.p1  ORF type:complete len:128 (-),score=39.43 TRINITY_DN1730_c0_g1_i15:911-1294(-)